MEYSHPHSGDTQDNLLLIGDGWELLDPSHVVMVLEQAERYCPLVNGDWPPILERLTSSGALFSHYDLVRFRDEKSSRWIFALSGPFDLRPLDQLGRELDLVRSFSAPEDAESGHIEFEQVKEAWRKLMNAWPGYAPPLRLAAPPPVRKWVRLGTDGLDAAIERSIRNAVPALRNEDSLIMRKSTDADIQCYPGHRLIEVLWTDEKQEWVRAYAYVKIKDQDHASLAGSVLPVVPVDGSSAVFHTINEVPGDLVLVDPVSGGPSMGRVDDYISTFCWGVQGGEGTFLAPNAWGEGLWHDVIADQQLHEKWRSVPLPSFSDGTVVAGPEEAATGEAIADVSPVRKHCRRTPLLYGNAVFHAVFEVEEATGIITMVDDTSVMEKLPLEGWTFPGKLAQVLTLDNERAQDKAIDRKRWYRRKMKHYLVDQLSSGDKAKKDADEVFPNVQPRRSVKHIHEGHQTPTVPGRIEITSIVLHELLKLDLGEVLRLAAGGASVHQVIFRNCEFHKRVGVANWTKEGSSVRLSFIGCEFLEGIDFSDAILGGSLDLLDCDVARTDYTNGESISETALNLNNCTINGGLTIWNSAFTGRVFAALVRISGNALFQGIHVSLGVPVFWLRFGQLETAIRVEQRRPFKGVGRKGDSLDDREAMEPHYVFRAEQHVNRLPVESFQEAALNLDGAVIQGALAITSANDEVEPVSNMLYRAAQSDHPSSSVSILCGGFNGMGMRVSGEANFFGTLSLGNWHMSQSHFNGEVSFYYWDEVVDTNFRVFNGSLGLWSMSVQGNLDLSRVSIPASIIDDQAGGRGGRVYLSSTHIKSSLIIRGLKARALDLASASVDLQVHNRMNGYHSKLRGGGLDIEEEFSLDGARIGVLAIAGGIIHGELRMRTASIGRVAMTPGLLLKTAERVGTTEASVDATPGSASDAPQQVHAWTVAGHEPISIGRINLSAVEVRDTAIFAGLTLGAPGEKGDVFTLSRSSVGGDLLFHVPNLYNFLHDSERWDILKEVACDVALPVITSDYRGSMNMQGTTIKGGLNLRNLKVHEVMKFNDMDVALDISAGSGTAITGPPSRNGEGTYSTTARSLNLEKLECGGDLDLTGLYLSGDLKAREMQVRGKVLFCDEDHHDNGDDPAEGYQRSEGYAHVGGMADLTSLGANRLRLQGGVFDQLPGDGTEPLKRKGCNLNLERSRIGQLEILSPTPEYLSLAGIAVEQWGFGTSAEPGPSEYIGVLKRMRPFDRGVWINVEMQFRNQSRNASADRVYRAMRRYAFAGEEPELVGRLFKALDAAVFILYAWFTHWLVDQLVVDTRPPMADCLALFWYLAVGLPIGIALIIKIQAYPRLPRSRKELAAEIRHWWGRIASEFMHMWAVFTTREHPCWQTVWYLRPIRTCWLLIKTSFHYLIFVVPTAYSTQVWRPMVLAIWSAVLCFVLFADTRHVAATLSLQEVLPKDVPLAAAAQQGPLADLSPTELDYPWKWEDGLALTVRYVVPLAPLITHDRWEASRTRTPLGPTAEQVAAFVQIYNWIAWPLFLLMATARAVRGKQN